MALSRLLLGWVLVALWLLGWDLISARGAWEPRKAFLPVGEALLLTLFGALWFGSLGTGAWWLVFLLVGGLREWPALPEPTPRVRGRASPRSGIVLRLLRTLRVLLAGGILAWRLGAAG
jgi:hypothetical protein